MPAAVRRVTLSATQPVRWQTQVCCEPDSKAAIQDNAIAVGLAARFAEFLERVLRQQAPLARPEEVAFFFLASYARAPWGGWTSTPGFWGWRTGGIVFVPVIVRSVRLFSRTVGGGTSFDTFVVDDRISIRSTWSIAVKFYTGDAATI